MCGPDMSNRPRGGALAVLNPTTTVESNVLRRLHGDLAFHTPGNPGSSTATHARWTRGDDGDDSDLSSLEKMVFVIHQSGDMTRNPEDCGLFHQFGFSEAKPLQDGDGIELALNVPISLEVGNDGIIGRRVSIFPKHSVNENCRKALAEGIVGFNFLQPVTAQL